MSDNQQEYIEYKELSVKGRIDKIKKSANQLTPLFEALTNSLEAIKLLQKENCGHTINIELYKKRDTADTLQFDKLIIEDNGVGFADEEWQRFKKFDDNTKGFSNKGSGRVQLIHFFNHNIYESTYEIPSGSGFETRKFELSKNNSFIGKNSIIKLIDKNVKNFNKLRTRLELYDLLDDKDKIYYSELTADKLKEEITKHYLIMFCNYNNALPNINLKEFINNDLQKRTSINNQDIPSIDQEKSFNVYYSKLDKGKIKKTPNKEVFTIKTFKINEDKLKKNSLHLTNKGEILENSKDIKLDVLNPDDCINGKRYIFFLSSEYIESRENADTRGEVNFIDEKEFKEKNDEVQDFFDTREEILLEDINKETKNKILSVYKEINEKQRQKQKNIEELQEMFLLNKNTLDNLKINVSDSDADILKKVYQADVKITANKDAEIREQIKSLEELDPSKKQHYQEALKNKVNELVKTIPLQNRTALTHYVARRKLVLELFEKVLNSDLERLSRGERIDEKLMHNLIFQQTSDDPENSDLWLINEDFVYFKGASEYSIGNLKIDGKDIIKNNLSREEEEYKVRQEKDMAEKRPDILLFPKEGKCIIIELKAPDVNVSEHLNQINKYASLINNLSKKEFNFNIFYGYLIGENIDINDIEDNDADFKSAFSLDFIFRPHKRILGKFENTDGSLYTEIIKYSTLLERAKLRNEIFIKKLENR